MVSAGVNRASVVPPLLRTLMNDPAASPALRQLSVLLVSSSTVSQSLREDVLRQVTPGLYVMYGSNEMPTLAVAAGMAAARTRDTVGYPIPRGELQIVDDNGRPVPPGTVGQIRARNEGMIDSYIDDPEADRTFFKDGWFYPGDLACWSPDGQVIFRGRADDLMIIDGINIFPMEIENCLQDHPGVVEAVAFPLRSERGGDTPAAAVRVRAEVTPAELIGYAKERLGVRHPRRVMIVDDFPRNEMGKPLRHELAAAMTRGGTTARTAV
jgi:acyl-CoA synthetase (AMP-forming)/AMP-acid ligase II